MDHHELAGIADLAFLHGGKQMLILDRRTSAAIVDFEAAFREAPLPPGPRPTGPESLPCADRVGVTVMNQNWGVYAAVAAFVASFGGAFAWIQTQRQDPPADGAVAGRECRRCAGRARQSPPEPGKKDPPPDKDKKDGGAVVKPPAPTRPTLIKRRQLAQPPKPKGEDAPNYERYFCREIGVDQTGSRVVTQTTLEVACWDAATGARLHTYPAASRTVPRKPPDKPELHIDEELFITRRRGWWPASAATARRWPSTKPRPGGRSAPTRLPRT